MSTTLNHHDLTQAAVDVDKARTQLKNIKRKLSSVDASITDPIQSSIANIDSALDELCKLIGKKVVTYAIVNPPPTDPNAS